MTSQSVKRPALAIKSVDGHTQFLVPVVNNSLKNKLLVVPKYQVINYLKPANKLPANTSSASQSNTRSRTSQSASILVHHDSKLVRTTPLRTSGRTTTIKLTEKQMKDNFMQCLGKCC